MPALFETIIKMYPKWLRTVWLLRKKLNNHLIDKMFLYYELISASFKADNISAWYISTSISFYRFNDGKLKWSFFSSHKIYAYLFMLF